MSKMNIQKSKRVVEKILRREEVDNETMFFALRFYERKNHQSPNPRFGEYIKIITNKIVEQNLGLVHACISKFNCPELDEDALFSEGLFAVTRCIKTYNPELGWKWATYVCCVILRSISKYIRSHKMLELFEPKDEMFPKDPPEYPSENVEKIKGILNENKAQLDTREMDVINSRFYEQISLKDLGSKYSLSKERIRQIQAKALKKIKRVLDPDQELVKEIPDKIYISPGRVV